MSLNLFSTFQLCQLSLCNKFVWQRQIVCKTFSFFFAFFTLYHEYNQQMIAEVL